jgi:C1A family cysteine protease
MNEVGMGWLPDLPDIRDYTKDHPKLADGWKALAKRPAPRAAGGPPDWRSCCSPVEDQKDLGSCTANAAVGMYEYFENRSFAKYTDASRLFIYKTTRNLLGWTGDTGATIRMTMGAMVLFGAPPEKYWPYTTVKPDFDAEPSAFMYAFGQAFQALTYYRLDPAGVSLPMVLATIKKYLDAGYVSMIGFTVYDSYRQAEVSGRIPFPAPNDRAVGGHAILLVGYDDDITIQNSNPNGIATKGAFLFKNSWGTDWGEKGYGWLPYDYVVRGLAKDCWSMLKGEWLETGVFGVPQP